MAAGSRFILFLPLGSLPRICNEVEDWRDGGGGSHASTSMPNPWQGLALATLAPLTPLHSCCNKSALGGCVSSYSHPFLAMVVWKEWIGRTQFTGAVVWCLDLWWLPTGGQFFPPPEVLCCTTMEVAAGDLWGGWQLIIVSMLPRSGYFSSDALEEIPHRLILVLLKFPRSISSSYLAVATGRPSLLRLQAAEVDTDFMKETLGAKMESLEAISTNMTISMRWYVVLKSHHALILEMITDVSLQHTQHTRFQVSRKVGCVCMLIGLMVSMLVGEVEHNDLFLCCIWIRNGFEDASDEGVRAFPFEMFHRWRVRALLLLVLRFNGRDKLQLSSVKLPKNLQLGSFQPQVHKPIRTLGEPPGYYR